MALFIGGYYMFIAHIANQEDLFRENVDKTVHNLREDFDINNIYLDSGRVELDILNRGMENFYFNNGGGNCMDFFLDDNFLNSSNFDINVPNYLGNNFNFIESDKKALMYLFYDSLVPRNDYVKLISCFGNLKEFKVDENVINWFDNDYFLREKLNLGSLGVDRENAVISYNLEEADYNVTFFENMKMSYFCPIRNFEILNLPFDKFEQNLDDFSILDNSVFLGSTIFDDNEDPVSSEGVILNGFEFENGDFLDVSLFEFSGGDSTISFWFKSEIDLNSSVFSTVFVNISDEYFIGYNFIGNGEVGLYKYAGAARVNELVSTTVNFKAGEWNNLIFVINNDLDSKFFLNGQFESSQGANFGGSLVNGFRVENDEFKYGAGTKFNSSFDFDEIRVLNFDLNDSQVKSLYAGELKALELDVNVVSYNSTSKDLDFNVIVPFIEKGKDLVCDFYYGKN